MDKHERFEANLLAVLLTLIGWLLITVRDESRILAVSVSLGIICLAVAHFILGYVMGRR